MKKTFITLLFIGCCFWHCGKDSALSNGYAQNAGQGGSLARFAIVGNYLYAIDKSELHVFDLTNPESPVEKDKVRVGFEIETIFPFKDRLFIGSTTQVHIFSIADPVHPVKLSQAISPTVLRRCDPVVAKDTVAFATLRSNGPCGGVQSVLSVIDIRDINKPVERGTYPLPEPYGLGYSGEVLYVCDRMQGLLLFDISKPFTPVLLQSIKDGMYIDVIPYSDALICWVEKGVIVYDITDKRNPVLTSKIN